MTIPKFKNLKFHIDKYLHFYMLSPAVIILVVVIGFPMLYTLYLSMTDYTLLSSRPIRFTFLGNYFDIFHDKVFVLACVRTTILICVSIFIELVLGMVIAALLSIRTKPTGVLRTLVLIPMMFAPVLVGFQFKWLFNDQSGLVNNIIFVVTGSQHTIAWLIEPFSAFIAILCAEVWSGMPFLILILFAGMISIPKEPFEAARVDGASLFGQARYVTIPLMSPYIYTVVLIRLLDISRTYDIVRIMTDGGPANRTELIWTYIYRVGISSNRFGLSSAMSFISVVITYLLITFFLRRIQKLAYEVD